MIYRYEVRRPIEDGPTRWHSAMTVSRHRTLRGASRSWGQQVAGARTQGGYVRDTVCAWDGTTWVPVCCACGEVLHVGEVGRKRG